MKRKIIREVEVFVKIVESKKSFKLRVDNDIRLKTIANKLCDLMSLDPYATEWAFFADHARNSHEIPISYTINQIDFRGQTRCLLAKIMTTTMKSNYYEKPDIQLMPRNTWYGKAARDKKDAEAQTDPVDPAILGRRPQTGQQRAKTAQATKPKVFYNMEGTFRKKFERPPEKAPRDAHKIWENLQKIEENKIFRGMNVVCYCTNPKCINYHRWITVSLGFGR